MNFEAHAFSTSTLTKLGAPEETRTPKIWLLRPTRIPIPSPGQIGSSGWARTTDILINSQTLLPTELLRNKMVAGSGNAPLSVWLMRPSGSLDLPATNLVGVERFELPTPWSQTRCATRLRYTPNNWSGHYDSHVDNRWTLLLLKTAA